jgi:Divergent InlB B-repeat domain
MIGKWFVVTALVVAAASVLSLSSCAHNTHLVGINIIPGNGTFAAVDPSASFQYRAYGTYIHPPKTVDITDQVTWQSSAPQVAQITGPGAVSPNTNCGVAQIFATMHDSPNDIVSNEVSITVDGPASLGCPQGAVTTTLALNVTAGITDGTIVSNPGGVICPFACAATFPLGTAVTLSATPNPGNSFIGWGGCDSQAGLTCNVTMSTNRTVTASFN